MTDIHRLRRAGGGVLRLLNELLPLVELPKGRPSEREEEIGIVFADVEAYSNFVASTDDDAAMAVLRVLDDAVATALKPHGSARVVKRLGDGVMIAATKPHEALPLAIALVEAFAEGCDERDLPLRLRAGIHRGSCRRLGDDYFGYHVNLAARVAAEAAGDQTLATANALAGTDLTELGLAAHTTGRLDAKGVNGSVPLFAVGPAHALDGPEEDHPSRSGTMRSVASCMSSRT